MKERKKMKKLKSFKDLVFGPHPAMVTGDVKKLLIEKGIETNSIVFSKMEQAKITFDNGIGLSVIIGEMFYSNGVDTYEAMSSNDNEPRGYLSVDELNQYMEELQNEPSKDIQEDQVGDIHESQGDSPEAIG